MSKWRIHFVVKRDCQEYGIVKDVNADNREDAIRMAREEWNEMFEKPPHMFRIKAEQRSGYDVFFTMFVKKRGMLPVIDNEW